MIKRYLAFDIGCIECGETSGVVGTFDTKEEAVSAAIVAAGINRSGQHEFEVYDLGEHQPEESHPEWEACR